MIQRPDRISSYQGEQLKDLEVVAFRDKRIKTCSVESLTSLKHQRIVEKIPERIVFQDVILSGISKEYSLVLLIGLSTDT